MKHSVKHLSKTRVQVSISVDKDDLATVKPTTLAKMAKQLKIAGFRAGKVPASVAEKYLDPQSLQSQIIEDAASKYVVEAFNAANLQALERPTVDIQDFKPGELLEFTAETDIYPEIKLGEYRKLKLKKDKVAVDAADVTKVLENMQLAQAEKKEIERAAKNKDEVWIDFDGVDKEGKPVAGASGKEYPLALGSNTFIPGFEEGLVGKKKGDEFDLPLTFPKDYHHKTLAGAKVTFKVKVTKVNEVVLPKLDDEFAKKAGEQFATLDALKADIEAQLLERKEHEATEEYKNKLVEAVLAKSEVPAPEVLVEDQIQSLERDMQQNLLYRGLTLDAYLEEQKLTKDEWRKKELRPSAEKRVQTGLLLAEITKKEDIELSQGELNSRIKQMMKEYPNMREQLNTAEAHRDIANRALTEKTVQRLLELQEA